MIAYKYFFDFDFTTLNWNRSFWLLTWGNRLERGYVVILFSDRWNILDAITICIYLRTFLLRMVTWASSGSVTKNRALVIAGYLYGLNTMFLTLRAFGHLMEASKRIGTIQIALFQIIGDVITIFWQFTAITLAFTMAVTKVFMAEKSYVTRHTNENDL